MFKIKF